MNSEWTADRRAVMKRNYAIEGRNRFFEQFNQWFGTDYKPMPFETLPPIGHTNNTPNPIGKNDWER